MCDSTEMSYLQTFISAEEKSFIDEIRKYKRAKNQAKTLLIESGQKMKTMVLDTIRHQERMIKDQLDEYVSTTTRLNEKIKISVDYLKEREFDAYHKYPKINNRVDEIIKTKTEEVLATIEKEYGEYLERRINTQEKRNEVFENTINMILQKRECRMRQVFDIFEENIRKMYEEVKEEHRSLKKELKKSDLTMIPVKEVRRFLSAQIDYDIEEKLEKKLAHVDGFVKEKLEMISIRLDNTVAGKVEDIMEAKKKCDRISYDVDMQVKNIAKQQDKIRDALDNAEDDFANIEEIAERSKRAINKMTDSSKKILQKHNDVILKRSIRILNEQVLKLGNRAKPMNENRKMFLKTLGSKVVELDNHMKNLEVLSKQRTQQQDSSTSIKTSFKRKKGTKQTSNSNVSVPPNYDLTQKEIVGYVSDIVMYLQREIDMMDDFMNDTTSELGSSGDILTQSNDKECVV